jgi:hypothetical protein
MKKASAEAKLPPVTKEEVTETIENGEVIYLRLSSRDKDSVKKAASTLRLTVTEYLLRCHALVSSKIKGS